MLSLFLSLFIAVAGCSPAAPTPGNRPSVTPSTPSTPTDPTDPVTPDDPGYDDSPVELPDFTPASSNVMNTDCSDKATLTLGALSEKKISRRLLGFNIVYCDNPDSRWADGTLAKAIKDTHPGYLRYPGGTVVTFYHWKNPSGKGWSDSWDPSYKTSSNKKESEFMNIDEYFALLDKTGALPLLGINCNSGFVYPSRLQEGINEALDLMKYAKSKGRNVKYWYIGNEPFSSGGNGGAYTPEAYANMVKTFAVEMKKYDPGIKIIVNDHGNVFKNWSDYDKILSVAGEYVDVIDVHSYWSHGTANWDNWLKNTPCIMAGSGSYEAEVAKFRELAAAKGYPNLEFATLEWNCGPSGSAAVPLKSADQITLIQAEMIMQFMRGGMDFACFWPLFWSGDYSFRGFAAKGSSSLMPIASVMKDFSSYLGRNLVETTIQAGKNKLYALAASDGKEGSPTLVCVMNKYDHAVGLSLNGSGVKSSDNVKVRNHRYDMATDKIITEDLHWENASNVALPAFSLSFIVL
ncbi:MAG: hypothetical protein IJS07_00400 [Bacteroidales bacterium]|nr:hypothetical protein [Bacteroidales bacterium]